MKRESKALAVVLAAGLLTLLSSSILTGCGGEASKPDAKVLETAFKDAPGEAPAEPQTTTDSVVIQVGADGSVPVQAVATRAAAAIRKDDLQEAAMMLQTLRRARNLTPAQLGAVQDQMSALQVDLANRAANGDLKAQQAINLLRQTAR